MGPGSLQVLIYESDGSDAGGTWPHWEKLNYFKGKQQSNPKMLVYEEPY